MIAHYLISLHSVFSSTSVFVDFAIRYLHTSSTIPRSPLFLQPLTMYNMERTTRCFPRLTSNIRASIRPARCHWTRCFSASASRHTDGVYQELTAMRTRTPFIEAFRQQQENKLAKPTSTENVQRDLTPKSMADSFTSVVRHLTSVLYRSLTSPRFCL